MCSTQMWFWPTCRRASAPSCDGVASGFSFEKFTGSRSHRGRPSWTDCWDSGLKFNVLRLLSRMMKSSITVKRSKMNISNCGNRAGRSVRTSLGRSVTVTVEQQQNQPKPKNVGAIVGKRPSNLHSSASVPPPPPHLLHPNPTPHWMTAGAANE